MHAGNTPPDPPPDLFRPCPLEPGVTVRAAGDWSVVVIVFRTEANPLPPLNACAEQILTLLAGKTFAVPASRIRKELEALGEASTWSTITVKRALAVLLRAGLVTSRKRGLRGYRLAALASPDDDTAVVVGSGRPEERPPVAPPRKRGPRQDEGLSNADLAARIVAARAAKFESDGATIGDLD